MHKEFHVGDHVYLHVIPRKSSLKLGSCANPTRKYCRPFEVVHRIGLVSYRLALPINTKSHEVFHVSLLNKYVDDTNHVIN